MAKSTIARFEVGDRCRCLHPYAYRGNEPFTVVSIGIAPLPDDNTELPYRYCYIVQYDDGVIDAIPLTGETEGGYELEKLSKNMVK